MQSFNLSDGDFLECAWHNKPKEDTTQTIVILFHGLEGSYKSPYIRGIMKTLASLNMVCVLMHFRGCGDKRNIKPRAYHSGDTKDAKQWLAYVSKKYSKSQIFCIGYSLGGNMLLKLLSELKDPSIIKKAVSISAPMQLDISADIINTGFSKIYQWHLLKHLKQTLREKYEQHKNMQELLNLKKEDIDKIETIREFDDLYTSKIHGFQNEQDYYIQSSAKQYLKDIKVKTLIIHSLDDPFMSKDILPSNHEISPSVKLLVSKHGGHVGFLYGNVFNPKYWTEEKIVEFFLQ
jgi:predicted alpha/beta-fold hydrolase